MKILRTFIALLALLVGTMGNLPARSGERDHDRDSEREEVREVRKARLLEMRERKRLEKELREANRAFQQAARTVQELQWKLHAQGAQEARARSFAAEARHRGRSPARIGIVVNTRPEQGDDPAGATIVAITPGSSAEEAGLRTGDVILRINGDELVDATVDSLLEASSPAMRLIRRARELRAGDKITLVYKRGGTAHTSIVEARAVHHEPVWVAPELEIPAAAIESWPYALLERELEDLEAKSQWLNLELVSLNPGLGRYFGTKQGVLVVRAPRESPLRVRSGDVIVRIGKDSPSTPWQALRTLRSIEPGKEVILNVVRDRNRIMLKAEAPRLRHVLAPPAPPEPPEPPEPD
jgi:C-terminal processing protease CtpA/Prc